MPTTTSDADDPALAPLAGIRPPPKPFPPLASDGRALCKLFMSADKKCPRGDACPHAHVPRADRPRCFTHDHYGLCDRGDACWLAHEPGEHAEMRLALMVGVEFAARHVERARVILGEDCVVATGRTKLARHTDALICINSRKHGTMGALRLLYEKDPYGMAKTKRVYAFPREEAFASFVERDSDASTSLAQWVEARLDEAILKANATADAPIYVRVRATPKKLERTLFDALDEMAKRRGEQFACKPPGGGVSSRDCTHCIDAISLWGRSYVGVWETNEKSEPPSGEAPTRCLYEADAPRLPPPGEATMDDFAVLFPLRLQDYRVTTEPICRAYFKLHEALLHANIDVRGDWNCVDIGAAPGGWTQVLSRRMAEDESTSGGVVWAIDPADVSTHLMPDCVKHLRVLAEDAVETVREGLKSTPSGQLRLVVCDANMHPEACVRIAVDFSTKFSSDEESWLILSTKNFCNRRENWLQVVEGCRQKVIEAGYDEVFVKHLFSNCVEEKTLFARRAPKN